MGRNRRRRRRREAFLAEIERLGEQMTVKPEHLPDETLPLEEEAPIEEPQKPGRVVPTALEFTPYAWTKMQWLLAHCSGEVAGFGITGDADHPLLVTDIAVPKQQVSQASVEMDDDGVVEWFDEITRVLDPWQVFRVWIHTHPSGLNRPSGTDERVMADIFGQADYYVGFILTKSGTTWCELRANVGPFSMVQTLPVRVRWDVAFPAATPDDWKAERDRNVTPKWNQSTPYHSYSQFLLGKETYPSYASYQHDEPEDKPQDDPNEVHLNESDLAWMTEMGMTDPEEITDVADYRGVAERTIFRALKDRVNVWDDVEWCRWAHTPGTSSEETSQSDEWDDEYVRRLGGRI